MKTTQPHSHRHHQKTWPHQSPTSPFTSLPLISKKPHNPQRPITLTPSQPSDHHHHDPPSPFVTLPADILINICACFTHKDLSSASSVCKPWNHALKPLREAMLLLRWGKKFKHGKGGVKADLNKALEAFLKAASFGSTLAMVDAGLVYWEMGLREKGIGFYVKAAELGDSAAMCNLAIAYLQDESADVKEAVKWLLRSASAGYVRAQYQLALCLHQGRGVDRNPSEAAKWFLRAAEGGYARGMYNVALCYSFGEGFAQSHERAKRWMKQAADRGHVKAQFEHGLNLFSVGEKMKAVVYLELASRAGEVGASHVRDVILPQLSPSSRERAKLLADNWRAPSR